MATITNYLMNQTELGANAFDPTKCGETQTTRTIILIGFVCLSNSVLVEKVVQH